MSAPAAWRRGARRTAAVACLAALVAVGLATTVLPRPARAISTCAAIDYCGSLAYSVVGDGTGTLLAGPGNELTCTYVGVIAPNPCQYEFVWPKTAGTSTSVPYSVTASTGSLACVHTTTSLADCNPPQPQFQGSVSVRAGYVNTLYFSIWLQDDIIQVDFVGSGSGSVAVVQPPSNPCLSSCTVTVKDGTSLTLTAMPAPGSVFAGWTGPCAGQGATCTFLTSPVETLNVTFDLAPTAAPATSPPASRKPGAATPEPAAGGSTSPTAPASSGIAPSDLPGATATEVADVPSATAATSPVGSSESGAPIVVVLLIAGAALLVIAALVLLATGRRRPT